MACASASPVAQLLVVQNRDDISGLDLVSLAHLGFQQPARGFGGDRRVVAFDPPAEHDDVGGAARLGQHHAPDRDRAGGQQQYDQNNHGPGAARLRIDRVGILHFHLAVCFSCRLAAAFRRAMLFSAAYEKDAMWSAISSRVSGVNFRSGHNLFRTSRPCA